MSPVFKRRIKCLDDFAKKLKTNSSAAPDSSEIVEKLLERLNENTKYILENGWKVSTNIQDHEKSIEEKQLELSKKLKSLKLLDKEFSNLTTLNTNLDVKIKSVKNADEEIEKETLQLEHCVSCLADKAAFVEKDKLMQREKIKNSFKAFLTVYNIYKIYTGCKLKFEADNIIVFQFSPDVYVKLFSQDLKMNWMLIDIKPDLNNRNDLEKKLIETDNVQGLLACLHEAFGPYF